MFGLNRDLPKSLQTNALFLELVGHGRREAIEFLGGCAVLSQFSNQEPVVLDSRPPAESERRIDEET